MSDTPWTDRHVVKILSSLQSGTEDVVHADFVRRLERALREIRDILENDCGPNQAMRIVGLIEEALR